MIIERELYTKIKPVINSPEVIIITGMRRVGKTILLRYIMEKIVSKNKIFLDLENPTNRKYFEENNYDKIANDLKILGLDLREKGYVFLDEIQFVKNIPSVVKYLYDHYKIKFFLSGSSSFYLKNLFSESLAGRKYIFELFPLSFYEFMLLKNSKINISALRNDKISEATFEQVERYYDEYVSFGGFPGVVQKENIQEKKATLEDIFSSYFQLEVVQLGDFKKINVVRDLMLLLMERVGSKLDVQKLSRELGVSRETINNYIAFLESTYFIKLIRPFSRNRDSEIRSAQKFYLCDSGIVNQFAKVSEGALFENVIFSTLRNKGEVNYYQKKSGVEIDFVLDKKIAYEVKLRAYEQDIKKLKSLSEDLKLKKYKIISRKYSELPHVEYGFSI
ncbi:MAG: ATP-binding protein [bacterium]|nr:ATP-binding protein [bacterium]